MPVTPSDFDQLQKLMTELSSSESAAAVRTLFLGWHWCRKKGISGEAMLDVLRFEHNREQAEGQHR